LAIVPYAGDCPERRPGSWPAAMRTRRQVVAGRDTLNTGSMRMSGARDAARGAASATGAAARAGKSATRGTARVIHRLTGASGAGRTGLDKLIELTAAGSVGDAFVAVSLAGTIFFSTSVD